MAEVPRSPRELETRDAKSRPKAWSLPELLPEPDRMPGYTYRWVRVSTLNEADPRNLSSKMREGFEPVALEEQPKFRLLADPGSRYKDYVEIGGLLLCKAPHEFMEQRAKYFEKQTQQQMIAVDNNLMRENDPRMPLFKERQSKVEFGRGK